MNIVSSGTKFMIYDDSVNTYEVLPVGVYDVEFAQMSGFFLRARSDFDVKEKVYGTYYPKIEKVLRSFEIAERNFGLILSGEKGIGKTMFMRVLAERAESRGYPVVLVNRYNSGLDTFLSNIKQEIVVLFDEFEKTFESDYHGQQDELLSLFDGLDGGKKLFIITCNRVSELSEYLINRPGRFHYHFELLPPSGDEIRSYLMDKVPKEFQGEIEKVVMLSASASITYDYLRAIASELNQGYSLEETLNDLNISRMRPEFNITLTTKAGLVYKGKESIDIYEDRSFIIRLMTSQSCPMGIKTIWLTINQSFIKYEDGMLVYPMNELSVKNIHRFHPDEAGERGEHDLDSYEHLLQPQSLIFEKIGYFEVKNYVI